MNAACRGSVLNKVPSEAFKMFAEMAEETTDKAETTRVMVNPSQTEGKIDKLCSTLEQFMSNMNRNNKRPVRACGICAAIDHHID